MRILIPGGSGFIGRYFYELLSPLGHELVIFDLLRPEWDFGRATFTQGDIRDRQAVQRAVQGVDRVLNLAAAHHDFGIQEKTYYDVNEGGAAVLCQACDEVGLREICFYSSVAIFGDAPEPHFENSPAKPINPYGGSKLAGEKVYEQWAAKGEGRRALIIRPTVTFGPRNFANMYSLIRQVRSGKFFNVGDGSNIKSLSYVENIVDATIYLWMKEDRPPVDIYHYVDKPDLTSRQIAECIYKGLGRKMSSFGIPLSVACFLALPFDIVIKLTGKNLPVSSARIRKLFATQTKFEADRVRQAGYVPKVPLPMGIEKMVKWYEAEGRHQAAVWHQPPAQVQTFSTSAQSMPGTPAMAG